VQCTYPAERERVGHRRHKQQRRQHTVGAAAGRVAAGVGSAVGREGARHRQQGNPINPPQLRGKQRASGRNAPRAAVEGCRAWIGSEREQPSQEPSGSRASATVTRAGRAGQGSRERGRVWGEESRTTKTGAEGPGMGRGGWDLPHGTQSRAPERPERRHAGGSRASVSSRRGTPGGHTTRLSAEPIGCW